jgi:hypothetical protein
MIRAENGSSGLHAVDRMDRFTALNYLAERPFIVQDLLRMCCADVIGSGAFRAVFDYGFHKGYVMKVCDGSDANVIEHEIWRTVKDMPYAKWFAPCIDLSPCGYFLVQKKTRPIKASDKLPKAIPGFFTDIKKENFGWIGKQLVCHDYQFLTSGIDLAFNTMLRKVDWNKVN